MCDAEVSCSPEVLRGSRVPAHPILQQAAVVPVWLQWSQCLSLPGFAHCSGIGEGSPDLARALTSLDTR